MITLLVSLGIALYCFNDLSAQDGLHTFPLLRTLTNGDDTNAIAAGDFNRDGAVDLVVGNNGQSYIYLNNGQSEFTTVLPLGGSVQTIDVAVADMNGDTYLDIVTYNLGASTIIYLNDGAGNFTLLSETEGALAVGDRVRLGDLDGDGDYDLVAARSAGNTTIYRNDGSGRLTLLQQISAGMQPQLLDDDQDGDLDLYLLQRDPAQPSRSDLYRYRNNGRGQLVGNRLTLPGGKPFQQSFVATDIEGDGDIDFIVSSITTGCSGSNCEDLRLLVNRGLLGYLSIQLDSAAAGQLALADLDHDGDLDVVATGQPGDTARPDDRQSRVYFQGTINALLGTASFPPVHVGTTQSDVRDFAIADLNQDGLLDIAFATNAQNGIYQNQSGYFFETCEANLLLLDPRLMADLNNDSYADLVLESGLILYNNQANGFQPAISLSLLLAPDSTVVAADLNDDGLLDLITGYRDRAAAIYVQTQNGQFAAPRSLDSNSYPATSIATGDFNSDGSLDIIIGRGSSALANNSQAATNMAYLNQGSATFSAAQPISTLVDDTQAVAVGDLDADGDLDLVVANATVVQGQQQGQQNYLYINDGSGTFGAPLAFGPGTDRSRAVALGDLNGDGHLDIVIGNEEQLNALYLNDGSGGVQQGIPIGQLPDATTRVLLVDLDRDRDLDLIFANTLQPDSIFLNNSNAQLIATQAWAEPSPSARAYTIAAGDLNHDGDIDLVTDLQPLSLLPQLTDCIMTGTRSRSLTAATHLPRVVLKQPGRTVGSGPYASAQLFAQPTIPIAFSLYDSSAQLVDVRGYYSLNGGGQWFPASAANGTSTTALATRNGNGPATHTFAWDVYGSNFLGHSDNVIFRLEVSPNGTPLTKGQPTDAVQSYVAAESYPLRVRGTQVRVVDERGLPVVGALLYKLPHDATLRGDSFPLRNGLPVRTNAMGFIESRGQLSPGDQLVALVQVSSSHAFTRYHSSAAPSATGLEPFVVQASGIQTLTVRSDQSLTLFNLTLSLEWDARNDGTFLDDLARAIGNASDVLFDVTEGQVALGEINVYQAKEAWSTADVVIYAGNSIHPRATMGGIVITPTNESGINGLIPAAYWPGQIRMGPQWDPFGQNEAELRQDWWLAFAHELAHYLLFLPDNYLGVEDGILRNIDCQGSFMTNTYEETYREFLTRDRWDSQVDCRQKSIAAHTTGRADWETLLTFMPWLKLPANAAALNPGPSWLPLNVTDVALHNPQRAALQPPLPARFFDLRDSESGEIIRLRQAQAYLFKQRNTPQLEDDEVIALGSTGAGSDRIKVRGGEVGDRLCLFQADSMPPRLGCETLRAESTSLRLHAVPGWQPEITVTPINSTTVTIDVLQTIAGGEALHVQVLPADGYLLGDGDAPAPSAPMKSVGNPALGRFQTTIDVGQPVFEGFVRIWIANDALGREAVTQFYLSAGWGPNSRPTSHVDRRVWGPNSRPTSHANQRAWGANSRSMEAPVASGDGRVTIFNVDDVLGDTGASALQALSTIPALPLWLSPVGHGYRYLGEKEFAKTIAFHYLEREVPKGYEHTLTIYYRPNDSLDTGANSWQRLPTLLDADDNFAAARMPQNLTRGEGIYALIATVEMPPLAIGWNLFSYPIPGERLVADALASLAGTYSALYHYDPASPTPWTLYDPAVVVEHPDYAPLINDLMTLRFGQSYWLYATEAITPYLAIALTDQGMAVAATADSLLPPGTLYGPIVADQTVTLSAGMPLFALINEVICGEGQLHAGSNGLIYTIQVDAGDGNNGCGYGNVPVVLAGDGFRAEEQPLWNHRQTTYQPLTLRSSSEPLPPRDPGASTEDPERQPNDGTLTEPYRLYLPILQN